MDRRRIQLVEPIREVGNYLVSAQLYKGVSAQLTITVRRRGAKRRRRRSGAEEQELRGAGRGEEEPE